MLYAHIFNARKSTGKKYVLIISTGASIAHDVIKEMYFDSKTVAKRHAKLIGATAYNY